MLAWRRGFYGWYNLVFLTVTYALTAGLFYTLSVNLPLAARDQGWSAAEYGAGSTAFLVACGLGNVVAGWLVPRVGPRAMLTTVGALPGVAILLLSFATLPWHAIALCALLGIGVGLGVQIAAPAVASQWFLRRRSMALAILLTSSTVMAVVWSQLQIAFLAAFGSWRSAVLLEGIIALAAPVIAVLFVRNRPADLGQEVDGVTTGRGGHPDGTAAVPVVGRTYKTDRDWTRREALGTRAFWLIFASICLEGFVFNGLVAHQLTIFEARGMDVTVALSIIGLIGLLGGAGRLIGGALSDRFEPRFVLGFFQALIAVGLVVLVAAQDWSGGIYLYVVLVGVSAGEVYLMASVLYTNYFGARVFPALVGILFPVQAIIFSGAAPTVLGYVLDLSPGDTTSILIGLAAINVVAAACGLLARPPAAPVGVTSSPAEGAGEEVPSMLAVQGEK